MSATATEHSRALPVVIQVGVASGLAVASLVVVGPGPAVLIPLYLAAVTPALVTSDLATRRLPNRLVVPGYLVAVLAVVGEWILSSGFPVASILAGGATFGFLLVLALAGGMGMGDVKLGGVLGLAAGLIGPATAIAWPVLAFLLGGIWSAIALARGRRGERIPFGPFLLAGFWIALLASRLGGAG